MIALAFTGYWPSLEDINRRQHETPTQELKLRPKTMPEPAPTAPVIANPRPNVKRRKIKQRVMFKRINHVEIVTDQPDRVYQMTRRCALAAVGAGFVAISISTYGADLGTRYSTALAVPSEHAPAGGRPTAVCPINPPDAKPDRSMQRTQIVEQLYEELMHSSGCLLASKNASIGGGCFGP